MLLLPVSNGCASNKYTLQPGHFSVWNKAQIINSPTTHLQHVFERHLIV
jgi:hypothetical protein